MATSQEARAARFARFVKRALADAKEHGLTIPEIEKLTGTGKSTLYRWRDGDWTRDPSGSQVKAFCEGLGISPDAAYRVLGWAETNAPEPEPELPGDFKTVLRRLRDPNVSETEKQEIRSMMRYLARHRDDKSQRIS